MISVLFRRFRQIAPVLFIALLVFALFGETLFPPEGKIIFGGDLLRQFYFWKNYLATSIKSGVIPFWNPYNFSGVPFLAHPSTAPFYPATILYLLLPLNMALSWNYFAHFILAGIGMFFLGKNYGGTLGGITAAVILVLSGFYSSRIYAGHVDILTTVSWIPWIFLGYKKFLDETNRKNWIFFVIFLGLQILAGYQAAVLFTLEAVAVYAIFRRQKLFKYCLLVAGIITSFALVAIQWLPTIQFVQLSIRSKGFPYEIASWGALPISGLKLFLDPFDKVELGKLSYGFLEGPLPNFFDYYVGSIPIILIAFTIFIFLFKNRIRLFDWLFIRKPTDFWFFIFSIIVFLVISFSYNSFINLHLLLYKIVPFYHYFRLPSQQLIIVVFLFSLFTGVIVGNLRMSFLKLILIVLIVLQLFFHSKRFFIIWDIPDSTYDKKLVENLTKADPNYLVLPDFRIGSQLHQKMDFNAASKYKVHTTSGYDPIILYSYYRFVNLINGERRSDNLIPVYNVEIPPVDPTSKLVNLISAKYIWLGSAWLSKADENGKFYPILSTPAYTLYQNDNALPRFFFVPTAKVYPDEERLTDDLISYKNELSNQLLTTKKEISKLPNNIIFDCLPNTDAIIKVKEYSPNKIILESKTQCNGFLSSSEIYYPGWEAKIDGKKTDVIVSNLTFRAIYLPKGSHIVEYSYVPYIYYYGMAVSVLSLIIVGMIFYLPVNPSTKPFSVN